MTTTRGRTFSSIVADETHENPVRAMPGDIVATPVGAAMGCAVTEGRVVHARRRVATANARVHDDAGTLYAHAKSTYLIQRNAR